MKDTRHCLSMLLRMNLALATTSIIMRWVKEKSTIPRIKSILSIDKKLIEILSKPRWGTALLWTTAVTHTMHSTARRIFLLLQKYSTVRHHSSSESLDFLRRGSFLVSYGNTLLT